MNKKSMMAAYHFVRVRSYNKNYKLLTDEKYRVDWRTLNLVSNISQQCKNHNRDLNKISNHALSTWLLLKAKHSFHFHCNRLEKYVNKLSRDKEYIELYPAEFLFLQQSPNWLPKLNIETDMKVVEVGLNRWKEICKIGLVLPLHHITPHIYNKKETKRFLFMCLGMDGGIKTAYITPYFKDRYFYSSVIPYVDAMWILSNCSAQQKKNRK